VLRGKLEEAEEEGGIEMLEAAEIVVEE